MCRESRDQVAGRVGGLSGRLAVRPRFIRNSDGLHVLDQNVTVRQINHSVCQ